MKKLLVGLGLVLGAGLAQAQTGSMLDSVYVEKYHVATSADHAIDANLPVGAITYRIYVDIKPGFKMSSVYGNADHALMFKTSTVFYNSPNGSTNGNTLANTPATVDNYDSWISMGGATGNKTAIPLVEDITDGTVDGYTTKTAATFSSISATPDLVLDVFDGAVGGSDFTNNTSVYSTLTGVVGATATNRVLIGQFTTDGTFQYALNFILINSSGDAQNYVNGTTIVLPDPTTGEYTGKNMTGIFAPNQAPTVSLTAPVAGTNYTVGDAVTITASASDLVGSNATVGSIASVAFFDNGTLISSDNSAPYSASIAAITSGSHVITASATDNEGATTTSASVTVSAGANVGPVFTSVTAPASAIVGDVVTLSAVATDGDGVASIEFFVNGVSVGVDNSAPFSVSYTATLGSKSITAKATDGRTPSASTTSSAVTLNVVANQAPSISISTAKSTYKVGDVVTIITNATDADGTIASVEYFVNAVSVGTTNTWTATEGTKSITAVATDNKGAKTTSLVAKIDVFGSSLYKIKDSSAACSASDFVNVEVRRNSTDTLKGAIGFDLELVYNKLKVTPTGVVKVNSDLIADSLWTSYATSLTDSSIIIGLSLNSTAPAGTTFNGVGQLVDVEFVKTANFKSVDTAAFSIKLLEESYAGSVLGKTVSAGKFTTYKDTTFVGSLKFWSDFSPIGYVAGTNLATNITGAKGTAVQPNAAGVFSYNINNGEKISISRDIDNTSDVMNVINGYDALLASKVAVKDHSFIPSVYQIIAMDVNRDGLVTSGDVSQINQRTVKHIGQFAQVGAPTVAKDWLFVDEDSVSLGLSYRVSNTYPENDGKGYSNHNVPQVVDSLGLHVDHSSNCPSFTGKTFKGILLGDANGSYKNLAPSTSLKSFVEVSTVAPLTTGSVVFDMTKATTSNGFIDVPVYISSNVDINSLDFAVNYNESNISFDQVLGATSSLKSSAYLNPDDQTIRFTSYDFSSLSKTSAVASVRFAMSSDKVLSSDLSATKAYLNGELVKSDVSYVEGGVRNNNTTLVVDVYPNPTINILNVNISQNASVEIFDILGKLVLDIPSVNANETKILNIQDLANGVYTLKVTNEKASVTVKVIKK
jgi:chitodextrinase